MAKFWIDSFSELSIKRLVDVFELIPDILFWIKDTESRIVYANNLFIELSHYTSRSQVYGKTDQELFSPHLAKQYLLDDQRVLNGELVTSRLEMNIAKNGELAWFSTSKRPLLDESGQIIGTYGITRHFQKSSQALATFEPIRVPLEYIRQNYHLQITLDQLADIAHLSVSALERRFKKYLAKTPTQMINDIRLENARLLVMESDTPISAIAYKTGFSDHSYFTKQFRQLFGMHPSKMREQVNAQPN